MDQKRSNTDTVKWIILVIVSVGIGTFIMTILGNIKMNIWFARTVGALVSAIVALFLHRLLIKNNGK